MASMLIDDRALPVAIEGDGVVDCVLHELPLQPRAYELWGSVRTEDGYSDHIPWQRLLRFAVDGDIDGTGAQALTHSLTEAPVKLAHSWRVE
jgi:hypothetical protein